MIVRVVLNLEKEMIY